nr:MAG TPA: hypothetical protein [Caudoviricetes sp.]
MTVPSGISLICLSVVYLSNSSCKKSFIFLKSSSLE